MTCEVIDHDENRTVTESLNIAWELLRNFPKRMLKRITPGTLKQYYDGEETK